jgi:hypothetical protein
MDFNFNSVFDDMIRVFEENLSGEGAHILIIGKDLLEQSKAKLEKLAAMFLAGSIDNDQLVLRYADVKMTIANELLAEEVEIKAKAQKAINGAIDVLTSALFKMKLIP